MQRAVNQIFRYLGGIGRGWQPQVSRREKRAFLRFLEYERRYNVSHILKE